MIPGITASGGGGEAPPVDELWTPAEITTQLWFDAADSDTITIGTGVAQWDDKSGNARHVAQATGANQPTHGVVTLNGLPVVHYDGVNDALTGASNLAGLAQNVPKVSYYVVRRFGGLPSGNFPVVFSICDGDAPTSATARLAHYASESDDRERPGGQRTDAQSFEAEDSGVILGNTWALFSEHANYGIANMSAYRDAVSVLSTTFQDAGNTSNTAPASIGVGCWPDGTTFVMDGDIGEIVVTHTIDAAERQKVEGYLAWKWGLEALLPAGHPYEDAPPMVGDPDPYTLSLLHFDGVDGATAIDDENGARAWTASGNAQLDTAEKIFGASSLILDGSGDFVTLDSPSLALGTGDFTIEGWIRYDTRSGNNFFVSFGLGWGVYTFSGQWAVFDGNVSNAIGPIGSVSDDIWYHVALVREAGTLALYVGDSGPGSTGSRLGSVANSTDHSTAFLRYGAQPSGAGTSLGNIDECRVSNVARYNGATYTVPAAPFTI